MAKFRVQLGRGRGMGPCGMGIARGFRGGFGRGMGFDRNLGMGRQGLGRNTGGCAIDGPGYRMGGGRGFSRNRLG